MIRYLDLTKWSFEEGRVVFHFRIKVDRSQEGNQDVELMFGMNKKGELLIFRRGWTHPIRRYTQYRHNSKLIRKLLEGRGYRKRIRYEYSEQVLKKGIIPAVIPPVEEDCELSHEDEKALVLMEERIWQIVNRGVET